MKTIFRILLLALIALNAGQAIANPQELDQTPPKNVCVEGVYPTSFSFPSNGAAHISFFVSVYGPGCDFTIYPPDWVHYNSIDNYNYYIFCEPNPGAYTRSGTMVIVDKFNNRFSVNITQAACIILPLTGGNLSCNVSEVEIGYSPGLIICDMQTGCTGGLTYTYQWEKNIGNGWSNAAGNSTASVYNAPSLATDTYFRRKVTFNGATAYSNELLISVIQPENYEKNYIRSYSPTKKTQSTVALGNLPINQRGINMQYFDGLGRPSQTVQVAQTPAGNDLVQGVFYDDLGLQSKGYLPYEKAANSGEFCENWINETATWHGDNAPYTEVVLDKSPLNRVYEQWGVGNAWRNANRKVKIDYSNNGYNEVLQFKVSASGQALCSGYYSCGSLYKTTTTDEDLRVTQEWKDAHGRVVLKESKLSASWVKTHYVYDDLGNLRWVLPPKLISSSTINSSWVLNTTDALAKQLAYYYRYDSRQRLIEKQLPGAEPVYMAYDAGNRVVLSQDGVQRSPSCKWFATQYDGLGRPIKTAIITLAGINTQLLAQNWYNIPANAASLPSLMAAGQQLTCTYYDTYPADLAARLAFSSRNLADTAMASVTIRTKGMVTAQTIWVLNPEVGQLESLSSVMYYDEEGRIIQEVADNYYRSTSRQSYRHNFKGQVLADELSVEYNPTSFRTIENITLQRQMRYDHAGRLRAELQKVNTGAWESVAASTYNPLSQIQTQNLGNGLQGVDHNYNIRGWLTKINDPAALNGDLFAMELKYEATSTPSYKQWGGNIGEVLWKTAAHQSDPNSLLHKYSFSYDGLSRLSNALYSSSGATIASNQNNESLTYDLNGNILTLKRLVKSGTTGYQYLDNLTYVSTGNQLQSVSNQNAITNSYPNAPMGDTQFIYDANGNMTKEPNRQLSVAYNALNLPQQVSSLTASDLIAYIYDASGRKLGVRHTQGTTTTSQAYVGPVVYTVTKTSSALKSSSTLKSGPQPPAETIITLLNIDYVGTSYGRLVKSSTAFKPEYHIKDYLGNVRVAFQKDANGLVELKQVNAYYPFGKTIASLNYDGGSTNDFKYNGKELQDYSLNGRPLDWYDYGARFYDPTLARFHTLDPLAEKFSHQSPFVYADNNPILFIDLNGENAWIPDTDENGNISYIAEKGDDMETFKEQFKVSDEQAQQIFQSNNKMTTNEVASSNYNEVAPTISTSVKEGDVISGQSVKEATGSNILKLDCTGKMFTPQRAVDQVLFGLKNESINGNGIVDFDNYFTNLAEKTFSRFTGQGGLGVNGIIRGKNIPIHIDMKSKWLKVASSEPNGQTSSNGTTRFWYRNKGMPILSITVDDKFYSQTARYLYGFK